jgi:putative transposase
MCRPGWACRVLETDKSSDHYRSRRPNQAALEARIKAIWETRVRYGYRRVHVLLQRAGWTINVKTTHMIYNDLGLQLRKKTPKRRVKARLWGERSAATRPNEA